MRNGLLLNHRLNHHLVVVAFLIAVLQPVRAPLVVGQSDAPVGTPLSSRQLLRMYGIDESQLNRFRDGRPLVVEEHETLHKVLFRLPDFRKAFVRRHSDEEVDWEAVTRSPDEYRGKFVRVQGRVRSVRERSLPVESAELFQFDRYFELSVVMEDSPRAVLVCARQVPSSWPVDEPVDFPTRMDALFLKVGDSSDTGSRFVAAANRVPWFPDKPDARYGVEASHVALAALGMDIGLVEQVRGQNRKSMNDAEREPFYQQLAATDQLPTMDERQPEYRKLDLGPLLLKPDERLGRCFTLTGSVYRVTTIHAPDDIRERFGIDEYYQLELFYPLRGQEVRFGEKGEGQGDVPVIRNQFPFFCCAVRLPDGLRPSDGGGGREPTGQPTVRLTGTFYRLWPYRTEFVSSFDQRQRQVSPLFMVSGIEIVERPARNPWWGVIGGLSFLAVLGVVWWGLWRYSRQDREFQRRTLDKQFQVQPGQSLDRLGIEAQDGPDFDHLE